jgi:cell wall-associated NlpC family hydrolase
MNNRKVKHAGGDMVFRTGILLLALLLSVPTVALAAKTHKVKKNETLASLAKKYHVSVTDLKNANNRLNASVKPGDTLVIPPRTTARSSSGTSSVVTTGYKVKKGDNLSRISKKTGISVADLIRLNGLGKAKLKTGQVLALHDAASEASNVIKVSSRPSLRYADLLSDKEYEQSLSELVEQDVVNLQQQKAPDFNSDNVKLLKTKAFGFLGTRYRFGGTSRNGLDCSAFVQKVFNEMEVNLPRTAREQFEKGEVVTRGDMQKGDLVFFRTYASFPSHVGIYLGGNRMIHASSRDRRVVISSVDTPYYRSRFIGAKRVAKISTDRFNLDELMLGVEEETPEEAPANDMLGIDGVEASN